MIIERNIGKWTLRLLKKISVFNRHYKVVALGGAFRIFRSIPIEKLKSTPIKPSNILKFKFDVYESQMLLQEYTAQIEKLDEGHKQLLLNVWDSEQMNTLIKTFSLSLTDRTCSEIKQLLIKKVFKEEAGCNYNCFIAVWLHYGIGMKRGNDRKRCQGTLKYSLKSKTGNKVRSLKSKFSMTKQEAIHFYSNISYWADK